MHGWMAYTCKTIAATPEFWYYQAPLVAFKHRYLMDAILAFSALHASRQGPKQWEPFEGRMVELRKSDDSAADDELQGSPVTWVMSPAQSTHYNAAMSRMAKQTLDDDVKSNRKAEMLQVSRMYLDRSMEGYRRAIAELTVENIEAVYLTSIVVAYNALALLGEREGDQSLLPPDTRQWLQIGGGTRLICQTWYSLVGPEWMASSGVFFGKPNMFDEVELFDPKHAKPLEALLTHAEEYENVSPQDKEVYQKALSFIGLLYTGVIEGTDNYSATCRRLIASPSRLPHRFIELAQEQQPRAMVMLAHAFASAHLVEQKVWWFRGVAARQVPKIYEQVPKGWRGLMGWPMDVVEGRFVLGTRGSSSAGVTPGS